MADFKSGSRKVIPASARLLRAEEIEEAKGWPELCLDSASWVEDGQVWVLEVEPQDAETSPDAREGQRCEGDNSADLRGDGNLEEISQSTNTERTDAESLALETATVESQCQSDEGKTVSLTCQQNMSTSVDEGGMLIQSSKLITNQNNYGTNVQVFRSSLQHKKSTLRTDQDCHAKHQHICNQCGKGFRWPSDLARHQHVHSRRNAARQNLCQLEATCQSSVMSGLPEANIAYFYKTLGENSENTTWAKNIHTCDPSRKNFSSPSQVAQHHIDEHHESKATSLGQDELETFRTSLLHQKSISLTDQNCNTKHPHICNECGKNFQWPSQLDLHQLVHSRRNAARQNLCQLESCQIPVRSDLPQTKSTVANSCKTLSENSVSTISTKNLHICDQCGKNFRGPSALARHLRYEHFRGKAVRRNLSLSEAHNRGSLASCLLPLEVKNTLEDSCETLTQTPVLTTDCSMHLKGPFICDQCGKTLQHYSSIPRHKLIHTRKKSMNGELTQLKEAYVCDQCGKKFKLSSSLAQHHRYEHFQEKGVRQNLSHSKAHNLGSLASCLLPLEVENTLEDSCETLTQTLVRTTDRSTCLKGPCICDQCGKTLQHYSSLPRHKLIHTRKKPMKVELSQLKKSYVCDQCGEKFKLSSSLARHHRYEHFRGKAVRRNLSQLKTSNVGSLTSLLRPLKADSTEDSCKTLTQTPMLTPNHSTLLKKPCICDQYGKTLQHYSSFPRHKLTHTTKKSMKGELTQLKESYVCDQCGKKFKLSSSLVRHHRYEHFREKGVRQNLSQSKARNLGSLASCLLPLEVENTLEDSCETLLQASVLTTDCSTRLKGPCICDQCGKTLQHYSSLPRHKLIHTRKKSMNGELTQLKGAYVCDQCGKQFKLSSSLARHHRYEHFRGKAVRRNLSQLKTSDVGSLTSLLRPLEADNTKDSCKTLTQTPVLTPNHSTLLKKPCIYDQCGKTLQHYSSLPRHKLTHTKKKSMNGELTQLKGSYVCDKCGKKFKLSSSLARHHRYEHFQEKGLTQNLQEKRVRQNIPRHKLTHTTKKSMKGELTQLKESYVCDQCGKKFKLSSSLARHHRYEHFMGKAVKRNLSQSKACNVHTSASFLLPLEAENTLEDSCKTLTQTPVRTTDRSTSLKEPFICDQCGITLQHYSSLARHKLTHNKRKLMKGHCTQLKESYVCDQCGKMFKLSSALAQHMHTHLRSKLRANHLRDKLKRSHHTTLKNSYVSSHCGKKTRWPSDLAKHELTHAGKKQQKSHLCEQYGQTFKCASDFTQHVPIHSSEQHYGCAICGFWFKCYIQLKRHQQWHRENLEMEGEEIGQKHLGMYGGGLPEESILIDKIQSLTLKNSAEDGRFFSSVKSFKSEEYLTTASNRLGLLPQSSIWGTGDSGVSHSLYLMETCECGYCGIDNRGFDVKPFEFGSPQN